MRSLLLTTLVLLVTGCGSIRSTIGIDPGEAFVLGGGQEGAFRAQLMNIGPVDVDVAELTASGDTLALTTLAPGSSADQPFAAGSAALLINRSAREASVQGVISGDTNLGMRYMMADGSPKVEDEITTNLTIPAGEQFVLGGGQRGTFTAVLRNDGTGTVVVSEVLASGDTTRTIQLPAGETATGTFAAGATALLINHTERDARVWAEVTGDTNLGMRYTPID